MILDLLSMIDRHRASQLARMRPVVIMSRGHSGTRVLAWALTHLGFALGTSDENPTGDADKRFTNRIKRLAVHGVGRPGLADVRTRDLLRFQRAVHAYHRWLRPTTDRWGWKFPETYLIAPLVLKTFPRARFVHLLRDGRDVAFKRHLTDNPNREPGRTVLAACGALDRPHHVQAAMSWAYQVDQFDAFEREIPPDQLLELRFEQLCAEPESVVRRTAGFLGVDMTASCETYLRTKVDAQKAAQHRHEDPALVGDVEECIGRTLHRCGYLASAPAKSAETWRPERRILAPGMTRGLVH